MKKLILTIAAFALFASGPAFAGCGSHGGGYARGSSASSYSMAPRATLERKVVGAKAVKAIAKAGSATDAEGSATLAEAAELKLQSTQPVAAGKALASADTVTPFAAEVARECKQYSATFGSLISIACES
jgi:hypothetical protein